MFEAFIIVYYNLLFNNYHNIISCDLRCAARLQYSSYSHDRDPPRITRIFQNDFSWFFSPNSAELYQVEGSAVNLNIVIHLRTSSCSSFHFAHRCGLIGADRTDLPPLFSLFFCRMFAALPSGRWWRSRRHILTRVARLVQVFCGGAQWSPWPGWHLHVYVHLFGNSMYE